MTTDPKDQSDGYHTFRELYEHRYWLWIRLCESENDHCEEVWRARLHSDGTMFKDSFVLGINTSPGKQMTYHLPLRLWEHCEFAYTLERAPEYDGHTSDDVLERLKRF